MKLWDIPDAPPPGRTEGVESARMRVLLAEDNMIAQAAIQRLLERQGIEVVCAANGREAVDRFEEGSYDLVMLDILMPDMDGFEVTSRIREKEHREGAGPTPVIALTSYSLKAVNDKCRRVGMNGYLSKPVSDNDLKELFEGLRGNPSSREPGVDGTDAPDDRAILDQDGCLDNLGGDRELYREIVAMFTENAPGVVERLAAALEAGDMARAGHYAHDLKGMTANIGAERLSELACTIQNTVGATRHEERELWVARLKDEFRNLTAAITLADKPPSP